MASDRYKTVWVKCVLQGVLEGALEEPGGTYVDMSICLDCAQCVWDRKTHDHYCPARTQTPIARRPYEERIK